MRPHFINTNHALVLICKNVHTFAETYFMVKTGRDHRFGHNVALIGASTDQDEWGRMDFGLEKGNKLNLGINLFFVSYFLQILSCYFPYIQ